MYKNILKYLYCRMEGRLITNRQECLSYLDELKIPYKLHEHEAVFNMQGMSKLKLEKSPFIKNLFFADKKPNKFYLIVAEVNTKPEKAFWKKCGTSHNNVRMAKEEYVEGILKSKKGALNPFALANDHNHEVKLCILDQTLSKYEHWAFHPMDNTATVEISKADMLKYLEEHKVEIKELNLTEAFETVEKVEKKPEKKAEKKEDANLLGIEYKKSESFAKWYPDAITKSGMIEYYDISGCYILRPWAFGIWERVQAFLDKKFKENGTENSYFPMFVSKKALELEKDHVEGFSPEVAWVTKSGKSDLAEPIAIRPTSETIMYPAYKNWIKSHRDLPIKLNQWTNIVRWEFKHPTPFIRTREFLWQEGHTAHASRQEADEEMYTNLDFYAQAYQHMLAVPVVKGLKTESEKFPGGYRTSTVETWIYENGRAIQSATSHNLGQNFAKMFGIEFEDEKKEKKMVWQTSWGFTTRSIGIMVMVHGDDKGLVLPPRVANVQCVVIPVPFKGNEAEVDEACKKLVKSMRESESLRVHYDNRDNYNPGWKYNHWELKGVPIRLELGPKDIAKNEVRCVIRHSGEKKQLAMENLNAQLEQILEQIQKDMYDKALQRLNSKKSQASSFEEFMAQLNKKNVVLTPWCEDSVCEEQVKELSGKANQEVGEGEEVLTGSAKTLCVPLEMEPLKEGEKCFNCEKQAKVRVFWGRSY